MVPSKECRYWFVLQSVKKLSFCLLQIRGHAKALNLNKYEFKKNAIHLLAVDNALRGL